MSELTDLGQQDGICAVQQLLEPARVGGDLEYAEAAARACLVEAAGYLAHIAGDAAARDLLGRQLLSYIQLDPAAPATCHPAQPEQRAN